MTEQEFLNLLATCIDVVNKTKGYNIELRNTKRTSEQNYQVLFLELNSNNYFEINFYWGAVEKIEFTNNEEMLKNGKLIVDKLYKNVKHW